MVIPGDAGVPQDAMDQVWGPASEYCASAKALLLIDPPAEWTSGGGARVVEDPSRIDALRATVVNRNAAVFFPRLR